MPVGRYQNEQCMTLAEARLPAILIASVGVIGNSRPENLPVEIILLEERHGDDADRRAHADDDSQKRNCHRKDRVRALLSSVLHWGVQPGPYHKEALHQEQAPEDVVHYEIRYRHSGMLQSWAALLEPLVWLVTDKINVRSLPWDAAVPPTTKCAVEIEAQTWL